MARSSYTAIPDADVSTGGDLDTTLWTALRDNIHNSRVDLIELDQAEVNTTSTSFVTIATKSVTFPNFDDYTGLTRAVTLKFEVKTTSTHTGTYRLQDNASGQVSSETTTTSTSYEDKTLTVSESASWQNTTRTINFQAKVTSGGTAYLQAPDRYDGYADV